MKLRKPAIALGALAIVAGALMLGALDQRLSGTRTATFDPPYPQFDASGSPIRSVMEGRIACRVEGCQKLKGTLVLYERAQERSPASFWLGLIGASGDDRVVTQGTWQERRGVEGYPGATVYALDSEAGHGLQYLWRVNDEVMLVLDERMRPRTGNSAWGYMLSRYDAPYGPRTYTWTP